MNFERSNCPNGAAVLLYIAGIILLVSTGDISIPSIFIHYSLFPVLHYISIKLQEHGCSRANTLCNCFFRVLGLISVLAIFSVTILVKIYRIFYTFVIIYMLLMESW